MTTPATFDLSPGELNGRAMSGTDIQIYLTFPMDLTGWSGILQVRTVPDLSVRALVTLESPSTLVITPGTGSSTVVGWIPADATVGNKYDNLYYALQLTDTLTHKRPWVFGCIQLTKGMIGDP